ncbi:MAG: hypothetical protein JJU29_17635 [Verrucomicrobia bacterium]|nr:hypothetical protein [Verrucomicrobiota bacterium]MCH8512882.1 hypothetical protein [Kiritimatiellia bacterium]
MRHLHVFCLLACLCAFHRTSAQVLHHFDPRPFRREALEGRDFEYDGIAFLHRLSFAPMPYLGRRAPLRENSFAGTVGSTRQDEFYVQMLARAHMDLDGPFFAGYRFRRDEDFDGRFDQNLIGLGLERYGIRFSLWGDIVGDKASNDAYADLSWEDEQGNQARFTWVAPDAFFNQKSLDANYDVSPYTYFVQGKRAFTPDVSLKGFAQVHPTTQLFEDMGLTSRNREWSLGLGLELPLSKCTRLEIYTETLRTRRSRVGTRPMPQEQDFHRSFDSRGFELRREDRAGQLQWLGYRALYLTETDRRPFAPLDDADRDREEHTLYFGHQLSINERIDFMPTVFLAYHDVSDFFPDNPDAPGQRITQFYGKFAPAFQVLINRETGAHMTFNLTTRLHRPAFGGGNIQAVFPF